LLNGAGTLTEDFNFKNYIREQELDYSETNLFELILQASPLYMVAINGDGTLRKMNQNLLNVLGYNEAEVIGKDYITTFIPEKQREDLRSVFSNLIEKKKSTRNENAVLTKNGDEIMVEWHGRPAFKGDDSIDFFIGVGIDITEKKRAETTLLYQKKFLEALFKNSSDAIAYFDENNLILDINDNFYRLFGHSLFEIKGKDVDEVINLGKPGTADKKYTELVLSGENITAEGIRYNREGKPINVLIKGIPVVIDEELVGGFAIYSDITESKQYEKQLQYLSMHDQLTSLYNRSFFEAELIRFGKSRDYPITIIVADLDGLKLYNDTIGHEQGDQLLVACSELLKKSLRESDILARIGGDEFVVILPSTDYVTGENIVNRIHDNIETFNKSSADHMPVSVSIGIATALNSSKPLQETFKEADDLMYRDKLHKGVNARSQIIKSLMAALGERDYITEGHARRLESLCAKMGEKTGLNKKQLLDLSLLAQVHDLGKVGIPDNILFKTNKLNEKEMAIMHQHSEKGYRIALSSSDLSGIADLILKHHEYWNGSGYPLGLKEDEIPIECRILAIADAFDAMTSDRPYRKAMSAAAAIQELKKNAGSQFDPNLVKTFLTIINEYKQDKQD
jgi:diguanylate cyclase (GGDEF)-like protein/PAS domain S-box-containing protein